MDFIHNNKHELYISLGQCEHGQIRLARESGITYGLGRLEVCVRGVWGTICRDAQWDNKDASVACRQLGYSHYGTGSLL